MLSGLLPLLNKCRIKILGYLYNKNKKFIKDIVLNKYLNISSITSISNDNNITYGTHLKCEKVKTIHVYYNNQTASAGEQCLIILKSLSNIFNIKWYGTKNTAGLTTCIKYFELSNYDGIEIPIGYMTDYKRNIYFNGFYL